MKKYLHNSDELFDSPQFGWEQMQSLLEKNLPQKKQARKTTPLLPYIIAASFMALFLLSSLVIKNISTGISFERKVAIADNSMATAYTSIAANAATPTTTLKQESPIHFPGEPVTMNGTAARYSTPDGTQPLPFTALQALALLETNRQPGNLFTCTLTNEKRGLEYLAAIKAMENRDSTKSPAPKDKQHKKGSWDLSAGLAVNGVIGEKQNLRPYPSATAAYNISGRFYISLGVAAGSPVSVSSKGINKTVYLNDTANNVNFYNNVKYYSRLSYADIPLMAGVNINKRLAVQAGVQASVLLNTKTKTAIDRYDFQQTVSAGLPIDLAAGAPVVSEEKYKVEAKKVDYRFIGGIKYTINNTSLHLTYQYAPKPALEGEQVSRNRNELISLGVQVKLNK